jgi:hypothetical protein
MTRKKSKKPYWEMTTAELREATKQFDEEFVADKSRPLTRQERELWEEIKDHPRKGNGKQIIAVQLDKTLLEECIALAKKKHISRNALITQGLKAILASENIG